MYLPAVTRWVGYLEHWDARMLGVPDANTGKGGWTIFARMVRDAQRVNLQGLPWCATFVHAVIDRPDLLGKAHPGCVVLMRRMKRRGLWRDAGAGYHPSQSPAVTAPPKGGAKRCGCYRPVQGDIIFCSNAGARRPDHVGIVIACDGETVESVDGNTVDPTGHFEPSQGGAVARRVRALDSPMIVGYGAVGGLWGSHK